MADLKISQLTGATTPLGGTEEVPLVQSNSTKKVTVANLTAGRSVSVASLTATTGDVSVTGEKQLKVATTANGYIALSSPVLAGAGQRLTSGAMNTSAKYAPPLVWGSTDADFTTANPKYGAAITGYATEAYTADTAGGMGLEFFGVPNAPGAAQPTLSSLGTWTVADGLRLATGNLIQGTAAKGINFTANTPAAGMTSQLLNWYEEGTWTPTATNITGTNTYTGTYTRIGNRVYWEIIISTSSTIVITGASSTLTLPFASGVDSTCAAANRSTGAGYGTGLVTGSNAWPPTCGPSASQSIVVSGSYRV